MLRSNEPGICYVVYVHIYVIFTNTFPGIWMGSLDISVHWFLSQEPRMSLRSAKRSASVKCPSPGDTNCQLQSWQGAFVTGSLASKTKTKVAPQSLAVSTAPRWTSVQLDSFDTALMCNSGTPSLWAATCSFSRTVCTAVQVCDWLELRWKPDHNKCQQKERFCCPHCWLQVAPVQYGSIHPFKVCQIGFWILSRSKGPVWPDPHSLKALWRTPGVWESLHRRRLSVRVLS